MVTRPRMMVLIAASLTGAVLAGAPAAAQSVTDRCRALPTESERFACMEGALAAIEAMRGGGAVMGGGAAPAPYAAPSAVAPVGGLGAEQVSPRNEGGGRSWLRLPSIGVPFLGGGDDDDYYAADPGVATVTPTGLGAESIAPRSGLRDNTQPTVHATIVDVREHVPGQWQFELDNGQVWRQISGDTQRINIDADDQPGVEMWASWAGGYRMRILGERQEVKVERIR